jgi:hypothetical protein
MEKRMTLLDLLKKHDLDSHHQEYFLVQLTWLSGCGNDTHTYTVGWHPEREFWLAQCWSRFDRFGVPETKPAHEVDIIGYDAMTIQEIRLVAEEVP